MNVIRRNHMNRSVRTMEPLSNEQLYKAAPSIFATEPWHRMSDKYAFIPTVQVIDKMRQEGFVPVDAMQSRTRIEGKGDFTKHLVRFRDIRQGDKALTPHLGQVYPELVLTNSHDGASAYKLDSGLFRLVCTNGMVVGDGVVNHVNVRHSGNPDNVIDATYEIVEQMPRVIESVESFQRLQLTAPEQQAFANAALALRYEDASPITPAQAVTPRRYEDRDQNLWNTFNVVQENLTQGGLRGRSASGRRQRTRPVEGISENTKLNKALWTLAEEMKRLKAA
jgi:hypothetical protein